MDIEKERAAFEKYLFSTEKFKFRNKNFLFMLDEDGEYEDIPVLEHWNTWQASANREGFVLVPREPTEQLLSKAIRKYLEVSHLPIVTNRMAHLYDLIIQEAMIEAQEQSS